MLTIAIMLGTACTTDTRDKPAGEGAANSGEEAATIKQPTTSAPKDGHVTRAGRPATDDRHSGTARKANDKQQDMKVPPAQHDLMENLSEQELACLDNPATLGDIKRAAAPGAPTRNETIGCLELANEFELYVISGEPERLAKDLAKNPLSRETKHCIWNAVRSLEDTPPVNADSPSDVMTYYREARKRARFIMLTIPAYCVRWANLFLVHGPRYERAMAPAQEICGVNPPSA